MRTVFNLQSRSFAVIDYSIINDWKRNQEFCEWMDLDNKNKLNDDEQRRKDYLENNFTVKSYPVVHTVTFFNDDNTQTATIGGADINKFTDQYNELIKSMTKRLPFKLVDQWD